MAMARMLMFFDLDAYDCYDGFHYEHNIPCGFIIPIVYRRSQEAPRIDLGALYTGRSISPLGKIQFAGGV